MLMEERFNAIMLLIEEKKMVTVQELTEMLNTSESTIRRDLVQLDKMGRLIKVHGGATSVDVEYATKDLEMAVKYDLNKESKEKIAKYAASLIMPNDFVYVDAGSTTEMMVDYITEKNATFVTNSIGHGKKLAAKGCKTYILGGELKSTTEATVGSETIEALQKYNFTKGFWGTNGVSIHQGFTTPDVSEAMVKRKSMERCKECFVLCDYSKFNMISPVTFREFKSATILTHNLADSVFKTYKNVVEVGK